MCEICERPDLTIDDVVERAREVIARHRFVVQSVGGSRSTAEFSYTAGLTEHGLPELIVTGLRTDQASQLLHHWAPYLLDESVVLPGETLESGPWLMEAVEVALPGEHLLLATRLYGQVVRGLQLVCADGRDRWPWDPGHRTRRAGQPVLGERASRYCEEHQPGRLDVPPHP